MAYRINPNTPAILQELTIEGSTLTSVGEKFGISKQRVLQIAKRNGLPSTVKTNRERREERYFLKWGNRDTSDLYMACRQKFRQKKHNAKNMGYEWSVEFGQLDWPPVCPILGLELDYFAVSRQENSPSFDRIDCSKGYIPGNVCVVSWRANRIKNDGTSEEHEKIAQYIRERQEVL